MRTRFGSTRWLRLLTARVALPILLTLLLPSAHATYKCSERGHLIYTDVPCPAGQLLPSTDLRDEAARRNDFVAATQRAEAEKNRLKQLVDERQRSERIETLQARKVNATVSKQRRLCTALGLKKKWLEEDVSTASKRGVRKTRTRLQRIHEQYALECASRG